MGLHTHVHTHTHEDTHKTNDGTIFKKDTLQSAFPLFLIHNLPGTSNTFSFKFSELILDNYFVVFFGLTWKENLLFHTMFHNV